MILVTVVFLTACLPISTQTETQCEPPVAPAHGRVHVVGGKYVEGSFAIYVCDEGRVMVGSSASKCQDNGQWTFPPPECKALPGHEGLQTPQLSSHLGSSKIPPPTSSPAPSRNTPPPSQPPVYSSPDISNNCTCTYINSDANLAAYAGEKRLRSGDIVNDGHKIRFHCSPLGYYRLRGTGSFTCKYCRTWFSSEYPKCELPRWGDTVVRIHATKDVTEFPGGFLGVKQGSSLRLICLRYFRSNPPESHLDRAPGPSEFPEEIVPDRPEYMDDYPLDRPQLPSPNQPVWQLSDPNAISDNTVVYNQVVFENGKTIKTQVLELSNISRVHNRKYVCASSSNRNKSIEVQVIIPDTSCPKFNLDNDFSVLYSKEQSVNSSAMFACKNPDDRIVGFASLTCMPNGRWSADPPECMKTCPKLQETESMRIYYSNGQGTDSTANFYCSTPRIRKGVSFTRCKIDGQWADPIPTCEISVCPLSDLYAEYPGNLLIMTDKAMVEMAPYNYTLHLNCGSQGRMTGTAVTVRCGIDGKWEIDSARQQSQGPHSGNNRYSSQPYASTGPPRYVPYPEGYGGPPRDSVPVVMWTPTLPDYYRSCHRSSAYTLPERRYYRVQTTLRPTI